MIVADGSAKEHDENKAAEEDHSWQKLF